MSKSRPMMARIPGYEHLAARRGTGAAGPAMEASRQSPTAGPTSRLTRAKAHRYARSSSSESDEEPDDFDGLMMRSTRDRPSERTPPVLRQRSVEFQRAPEPEPEPEPELEEVVTPRNTPARQRHHRQQSTSSIAGLPEGVGMPNSHRAASASAAPATPSHPAASPIPDGFVLHNPSTGETRHPTTLEIMPANGGGGGTGGTGGGGTGGGGSGGGGGTGGGSGGKGGGGANSAAKADKTAKRRGFLGGGSGKKAVHPNLRRGILGGTSSLPTPSAKKLFKMEDCTLHCRGVPEDKDAEWLRHVFGEFGEFVQGTIRVRKHQGRKANYALVTFRNEDEMNQLLERAQVEEGIRPRSDVKGKLNRGLHKAKGIGKMAASMSTLDHTLTKLASEKNRLKNAGRNRSESVVGSWSVVLRAFPGDQKAEGFAWLREEETVGDERLFITKFGADLAQGSTGGLADCWDAAAAQVKTYFSNFHLFLAIDQAAGLPCMDLNAGDPFCKIWYVNVDVDIKKRKGSSTEDQQSLEGYRHQEPREAPTHDELDQRNCFEGLPCSGWGVNRPPPFVGQGQLLGKTTVESDNFRNPVFLWNLAEPVSVPFFQPRGWLIIEVIDEDKFEDDMIGQIHINLDQVNQDTITEGWYYVSQNADPEEGFLNVRMLLSSFPDLADTSRAWLLSDFDVVQICQSAIACDENHSRGHEGIDQYKLRGLRADSARLRWRTDELCDKLFKILDTDSSGVISPHELSVLMALLGEELSQKELGQMVAEAKAWGRPTIQQLDEAKAQHQGLHLVARQMLLEWHQDYEHAELTDGPDPLPIIDLDDAESERGAAHYGITRGEFKFMLTEYWTSRKYTTDVSMERGLTVMGTRTMPEDTDVHWEEIMQVRKDGRLLAKELTDADTFAVINADRRKKSYCCGRCGAVPGIMSTIVNKSELPPVPTWVTELSKVHEKIKPEVRTPQMMWWFLSTKGEHVLMRAEGRGMLNNLNGGKLFDPGWRNKLSDGSSRMKSMTIRSIGSQDGSLHASSFSIAWDLMQVVLLGYVLVSVPFCIAYDVAAESGSKWWWWELFIDVYFILDIVINFRTPFYFHGELHNSSRDMASRYLTSWFVPDVLSCASLLQYGIDMDVAVDGSAAAGGRETPSARLAKLVRLTKLAKLLRLARLKRSMTRLADYAFEHLGGNLLVAMGAAGSVINLILGFALAMHLTSCIFYLIGTDGDDGWVSAKYAGDAKSKPIMERYFESMFMVALGDLQSDDAKTGEEIFAIISVLVNGFVFGAVAATFSSIMVSLNEPYAAYNNQMDMLKTWMRSKHLDISHQQQIEDFFSSRLSGSSNAVNHKAVDETSILKHFQPSPLADELIALLYAKTIKSVPMFATLPEEVVSKLCLALQPLPAMKGSPVTVQGRVAECMYLVNNGRCQVWENSASSPMMARCSLVTHRTHTEESDHFWASVFDKVAPDFGEASVMTTELQSLKLVDLVKQCRADGVSEEDVDTNMDHRDHLIRLCVDKASGGTMDLGGAENRPELRHRTLSRKNTKIKARARHSSEDSDAPIRRSRFYEDFDPSESGEFTERIVEGTVCHVHEVRQGAVVGYLEAGDYTGEGCFLSETSESFRYTANVTAMTDSDLCFLNKQDLEHLKTDFPSIQTTLQTVQDERESTERPRRMFASAANGDATLDKKDMRKLLQDEMFFADDTKELEVLIKTVMSAMDTDGDGTVDEFEFDSWFRAHNATEQDHFNNDLSKRNLADIVQWASLSPLPEEQVGLALNSDKPKQALIDKILSVPKLLGLLREDEAQERDHLRHFILGELEADEDYLENQAARRDTDLTEAEIGLIYEDQVGDVASCITRMLSVPKVVEDIREQQFKKQLQHEPDAKVARLLYSTPGVLRLLVRRRTLSQLTLGALYTMAKDGGIAAEVIHNALNDALPKQKLLDALAPQTGVQLHRGNSGDGGSQEQHAGRDCGGESTDLKEEVAALREQVAELTKLMKGTMDTEYE